MKIISRGTKIMKKPLLDTIVDIYVAIACIILTLAAIGIIPLFIWGFTQ